MMQTYLKNSACWFEHMSLDLETGLGEFNNTAIFSSCFVCRNCVAKASRLSVMQGEIMHYACSWFGS